LEGIHIEKIARAIGLNKSSFYHFFGTLEVFHEQLILHHYDMIDMAMKDGEGAQTLDPDYLTRMLNHKVAFMVQVQLTRHKSNPLFSKAYLHVNRKIDKSVILLWNKYLGVFDNDSLSLLCLSFVRDTFYSRVSLENFDYNFLHDLAIEAKKVVDNLKEGKISLNKIDPHVDSKRSRLESELPD
jgi:AcrR family transcriptional regulator